MNSLIKPARQGSELRNEILGTTVEAGSLAFWWLGQSGFLIKSRTGMLLIDPYLSESLTAKYAGTAKPHVRMTECPIRGDELSGIDLILASHKHSDHIDPGTLPGLMASNPQARLIVPASLVEHTVGLGLPADRVGGIDAGECAEVAGFRVRAIPSAHEGLDTDDQGQHLYLGFVVEAEGQRLYHSGDTMPYDGLSGWLGDDPYDVMFLPVNGRDPARGVSGNMSAAQAVDLAIRHRPRFLVPHHYEMFTFNTISVEAFEAEAQRLPTGTLPLIVRCGERREI